MGIAYALLGEGEDTFASCEEEVHGMCYVFIFEVFRGGNQGLGLWLWLLCSLRGGSAVGTIFVFSVTGVVAVNPDKSRNGDQQLIRSKKNARTYCHCYYCCWYYYYYYTFRRQEPN
jgi:hypothetical protein